ncbi:lipid II:glycine glycyltransferase FemX [Cytobacillus massiliigabonensis]|uniref:lipid II:glycine glycyltransferase FemX n=1 Tax=Cytobacillus massiliigabonensis TaxID=1871011 RepID=UPI000C84827E|nr:GNAT family N-acetyltransferase [Cytobacillus massiliigabonensis]
MYEVIPHTNKCKWDQSLEHFREKDIFYFHSYCGLYPSLGDGDPYLFIYTDKNGSKVCYAFFKRPIQVLPFAEGKLDEELFDIITPPYGYGGPFYENNDVQLLHDFRKAFEDFCQKENIISEFIRFHPLYKNHHYLDDTMDVFFDRETVFINLRQGEEEILGQYHKNHKRNFKKAMKNKLTFHVHKKDDALQKIDAFYSLYRETMDKLNASPYAYFSIEYVENLITNLDEHSFIASVYFEGEMVSAALCLCEGGNVHYHLGCSKQEMLPLGGNVFLFHSIALWTKQNGFHTLHLGGGHVGRDSLFQFKHRFNPKETLEFYVGRKIHHKEKYDWLVTSWEKYYARKANGMFFPAYRMNSHIVIPVESE